MSIVGVYYARIGVYMLAWRHYSLFLLTGSFRNLYLENRRIRFHAFLL